MDQEKILDQHLKKLPSKIQFEPQFKNLVNTLIDLIKIENEGKRVNHRKLQEYFVDWKAAQILIIDNAIDYLNRVKSSEDNLKQFRISKDNRRAKAVLKDIRTLNIQIVFLRRIFDYLPWMVLEEEYSTTRRLAVKGGGNSLSVAELSRIKPIIAKHNEAENLFALCNDLSTFIHIGDLTIFNSDINTVHFIELKEGTKNIELS